MRVRLWPGDWRTAAGGRSSYATRQDIMAALVSIDYILIRVAYLSGSTLDTTISNIKMDTSGARGSGPKAPYIERCRCPPGYEGDSCQLCSEGYERIETGGLCPKCQLYIEKPCPPGTYGDQYSGCRPCPCPLTSPSNRFGGTCHLDSDGQVTCNCPAAYSGRRCEYCSPGHTGNPLEPGGRCVPLGECNESGSLSLSPDPSTGLCDCKAYVTGPRCERCAPNTFSLSSQHQHGCINCFCMAITENCSAPSLYRDQVRVQFSSGTQGFSIAPLDDLLDVHNVSFSPNAREITYANFYPKVYYWVLPELFLGDKVTSYGGYLTYTLRHVPTPGGQSSRNNAPDVELRSLNNIVLVHRRREQVPLGVDVEISVPIFEQYWTREDGGEVDRAHLLMALADLSGIYIKATYTTNSREASLKAVSLDIATETSRSGTRATEVELCQCPIGYRGTSCEDCDAGYTRTEDGLYLGLCEPCNCNNHSNTCHPETGECEYCSDNTAGPRCEDCLPGFSRGEYGNCVRRGDDCDCDPRGVSGPCFGSNCQCKVNVEGERCDRCRSGTFGLTASRPEGCLECHCSGVTTQCQQSNLYRESIPTLVIDDNHGFTLHYSSPYADPSDNRNVIRNGFDLNFAMSEVGYLLPRRSPQSYFWSLPSALTGNKVTSYGGLLKFKLRFTGPTRIELQPDHNIIIIGNGISLFRDFEAISMEPDIALEFQIPLIDDGKWKIMKPTTSQLAATRFDMLKVLSNLENILILASLDNSIESTHISDVAMDTAVPLRRGKEASEVEVCRCPSGYRGSSCEICSEHFYRNYDQTCQVCPCNGNDESCSLGPDNRVRCNCRPGYFGSYCESQDELPRPSPPTPVQPTITISISEPTIGIVEIGSTANYHCSAFSSVTQDNVDIRWTKEGGPLPSGAIADQGHLIIRDARPDDSGVYVCTASDGRSVRTDSITVVVGGKGDEAPRVTVTPTLVERREGERLELRCSATGSPRPSIEWRRTDGKMLPSQTQQYDGVLRINGLRSEDSGEYSCYAMNREGTDVQYSTVLVRDSVGPSTLTTQPRRFTGVEGDTITIVCSSPRNFRLVWTRRDGRPLGSNARERDGTLTIYNARAADAGAYLCTAENAEGRHIADAESFVDIGLYRPGTSGIVPERQTVPQGRPAEMRCTSSDANARFTWAKRDESLPSHVQVSGGLLKFVAVRVTDRGMYQCTIESPSGITTVYSILEVERREPPTIELYPHASHTLSQGSSMLLQCRVTAGIPTPTVYWTRPGNTSIPYNIQQGTNGVLRFNNIRVSDSGEYVCHAENAAGSTSATATIAVQSPPVARVSPGSTVQLREGALLKLECTATGYPKPTVMWSRHHAQRRTTGLTAPSYESAVYEALASGEDEGLYICIARNDAGTTEERVEVFITDSNRVPSQPSSDNEVSAREIILAVGESGSLSCNFAGDAIHYGRLEWGRADRRPLPEGAHQRGGNLYFNEVDDSAAGDYVCAHVDDNGAVLKQSTATVIVNHPPRIRLIPPRQVVRPGADARIDCEVEGERPVSIRWDALNRSMPPSVSTQHGLLIFQGIAESDAGQYVCIATNRYGEATSIAEVFVNVVDPSHRQIVKALNGKVETPEGSTVTLQCVADITAQMEWRREGRDSLPSRASAQGNSLRLEAVSPEDSGRYTCFVILPTGVSGSDYIDLSVIPNRPSRCLEHEFHCGTGQCIRLIAVCDGRSDCPDGTDEKGSLCRQRKYWRRGAQPVRLHISPSIDVIKVGSTVDLRCLGTGVSPSQISWTKLGERMATNIYVSQNVLKISDVTMSNAGMYRCSHRAPNGNQYEADYILNVQAAQPFPPDHEAMEVKTADVGQTVTLNCNTNLEPPVRFTWTRHGGPLPPNAVPNQSQLVISNINGSDAGMYICSMANGEVTMEKQVMVTVSGLIPSFQQNPISYIVLPMLLDASIAFDIELLFRPEQPDGLMLYNGQTDNGNGDFISIGMRGGRPEFRFEVGSGPAIITGRPVSMRQWHRIKVSRDKKKGEMWVDGEGPYTGESKGRYQALDLDRPLYIGAVPEFDQISREADFNQGFIGCISELKTNGIRRSLDRQHARESEGVGDCDTCRGNSCANSAACQQESNSRGYRCLCPRGYSDDNCSRLGESCYEGICGQGVCVEAERGIRCQCPIDKAGERCERHVSIRTPQFSGRSYVSYQLTKSTDRLKTTLKLHPEDNSDGILLLLMDPNSQHYVALTLRERHLELTIDRGQGVSRVRSQSEVKAGEWDTVTIGVDHRGAYIQYRDITQYDSNFNVHNGRVQSNSVLFLGGIDQSHRTPQTLGVYNGFTGCISSIDMFGQSLNIIYSAKTAENVEECRARESTCRSNPCRNGGSCSIRDNSQFCICPPGYSGPYCKTVNTCEIDGACGDSGECEPLGRNKHRCHCTMGLGGVACEYALNKTVSLSGDGWVELDSSLLDHSDSTRAQIIQLVISTSSPDGLILYQGQKEGQQDAIDFLAIAVVDGEVEVRFELGSGEGSVSAPMRVDDGQHHTIEVTRTALEATVIVDQVAEASGSSPGHLSQLNAPSSIYIGGLPDLERRTGGRYRHGFSGCIHSLKLPDRPHIDFGQSAIITVNALPCDNSKEEVTESEEFDDGFMEGRWN